MKRVYPHIPFVQRIARVRASFRTIELPALLSMMLVLSACASTNQMPFDSHFPEAQPERPSAVEHPIPDVEYVLRSEISEWAGSPHRLGGTTVHGIDCSGFVQNVYQDAFNVQLPRTTREQVQSGTSVRRRDLQPGDLVFFRPPTKSRHVGIYLNDGEFAHASSSEGVTVSDLNHEYWDQAYWTSRRILPESARPVTADRTRIIGNGPLPYQHAVIDAGESDRERIGW